MVKRTRVGAIRTRTEIPLTYRIAGMFASPSAYERLYNSCTSNIRKETDVTTVSSAHGIMNHRLRQRL